MLSVLIQWSGLAPRHPHHRCYWFTMWLHWWWWYPRRETPIYWLLLRDVQLNGVLVERETGWANELRAWKRCVCQLAYRKWQRLCPNIEQARAYLDIHSLHLQFTRYGWTILFFISLYLCTNQQLAAAFTEGVFALHSEFNEKSTLSCASCICIYIAMQLYKLAFHIQIQELVQAKFLTWHFLLCFHLLLPPHQSLLEQN